MKEIVEASKDVDKDMRSYCPDCGRYECSKREYCPYYYEGNPNHSEYDPNL
jgi:uncharacterized OB-fold protein